MSLDSETTDGGNALVEKTEETSTMDVFHILSNPRRRYAILYFLYFEPAPTLGDLAQQIAAWENQKSVDRVTSEERRMVYNALQQFHLPKMDKAGMIEYDSTQHTIESTDGVRVARPYLEVVPGTSLPWCLYYFALGGISVILTTAIIVNVISIPATVVALLISVVLVASGAVHIYSDLHPLRRRTKYTREDE